MKKNRTSIQATWESVRRLGYHAQPEAIKWDSHDVMEATRMARLSPRVGPKHVDYGHYKQWFGRWGNYWYRIVTEEKSEEALCTR